MVGFNLGQFINQGRVVDIKASEPGKGLGGRVVARAFNEVARRFGQDEHTKDQNNGPGELNGDGDTVGTCIVTVMRGIVDDGGKKQADGDGKLVTSDNGATNPFGSRLGLVERHNGRE